MKIQYLVPLILLVTPAYADPLDRVSVKLHLSEAYLLEQTLVNAFRADETGKPYKFEPNLTYSIAMDVSELEPMAGSYEKTRKEITEELKKAHSEDLIIDPQAPQGVFKPGSHSEAQLLAKLDPIWNSEAEFHLIRLKLGDFNLGSAPDKNHISPTVLIPLIKILDPK